MATARINNADDIKCTLEFTMSIKDWKQIRTTLNKDACYAEVQVIQEINDLVHQLENVLYSNSN